MKNILLLVAVSVISCSNIFAEDKEAQIDSFIACQRKIFQIAKQHPEPFKNGTSNLNDEVLQALEALKLEELESMQLWRLAIACSVATYPQEAGDQRWDLLFDDVCWRCVKIIAARPGKDNANFLKSMKDVFGADGGASLWFKDYIDAQAKLKG